MKRMTHVNQPTETADETAFSRLGEGPPPVPGMVVIFSSGEPLLAPVRVEERELTLGRGGLSGVELSDHCMSRSHVSVSYRGGKWTISDLGSRNGTYVGGEKLVATSEFDTDVVLRTGETLSLLLSNIRPFLEHPVEFKDGYIVGPRMQAVLQQVNRAANSGVLHVTGETGSGKEIAAKHFHRFGTGKGGPFVAVNCAAIPEGVAERLLFGAKKGAYSGADADSRGYVQEATGGTLFLDEVGELELAVQAKLLRVLETREVLPLGASRPLRVDIRLCSATHKDLREAVAKGKFREDLFYRLGRPHVALPPLRSRPEEMPFLIERQLRETDKSLVAHATFVEACLLRPWPGNVRELLSEVRDAAFEALSQGKTAVKVSQLSPDAGLEYAGGRDDSSSGTRPSFLPGQEEIEQALKECEGRVATAARTLGVHRNQLRRWLDKNAIDPKTFVREPLTRSPGSEDR